VEQIMTKKGNTILESMEQIMIKGNKNLVDGTSQDYKAEQNFSLSGTCHYYRNKLSMWNKSRLKWEPIFTIHGTTEQIKEQKS
jgi:hypothetical protein